MLAWISKDHEGDYVLMHGKTIIKKLDDDFIRRTLRDFPKDEELPIQIKI